MEAISYKGFSMTYNEGGFALRDIDLEIDEGEFVVVTGGTGSGKSTLLRQIKREFVSSSYSGSLKVLGKEMREATQVDTMSVGYVMQFPREQIVTDKVFHELSFGLENMGLSADEIRLRVSETAHYFGLSNYMDKSTYELSGGEMQIVNLASVMAMRPRILLLDEPTSQLDEVTADRFLSLVYRINRELGTTVIIAEHRLDMLDKYTRVVIMDNGTIAYNGTHPSGYRELPIYRRVGEKIGKELTNIVECRSAIMDAKANGKIRETIDTRDVDYKGRTKALSASDIWFRYRREDRDVLKGLDLTLYEGEILSIIGGNGVGKSTLLTILSGVRPCHMGKVKNYGNKVIYLPQNPSFVTDSVDKEIDSAIECYVGVYRDENKKRKLTKSDIDMRRIELRQIADEYIELFGLKSLQKSNPYEISGGERAKLAILIGLLSSPDVLLLDEPTKGLDIYGKEIVTSALEELVSMGKSIILVSHDIELVAEVSDRVGTLFDGRILSICTPKKLLSSNYLYTTTTSRITRGIADEIVTERELLEAIDHD